MSGPTANAGLPKPAAAFAQAFKACHCPSSVRFLQATAKVLALSCSRQTAHKPEVVDSKSIWLEVFAGDAETFALVHPLGPVLA